MLGAHVGQPSLHCWFLVTHACICVSLFSVGVGANMPIALSQALYVKLYGKRIS